MVRALLAKQKFRVFGINGVGAIPRVYLRQLFVKAQGEGFLAD